MARGRPRGHRGRRNGARLRNLRGAPRALGRADRAARRDSARSGDVPDLNRRAAEAAFAALRPSRAVAFAEAALALLVLEQPSGQVALADDSSYVRLAYTPPSWSPKENISLTAFPVSADRFRLGYTYRISWGGSSAFTSRAAAAGLGSRHPLLARPQQRRAGVQLGQLPLRAEHLLPGAHRGDRSLQ